MAAELRRVSGDPDYAARITRSERNSHQLERNFAEVGQAKPRVAVTVDLLSTGFDAPDVRNIVFARPLKSAILYKQMKGRGHAALRGHRQAVLHHLRLHRGRATRGRGVRRTSGQRPDAHAHGQVEAQEAG